MDSTIFNNEEGMMMKYITGEYRFRNQNNLIVLQIKEIEYTSSFNGGEDKESWRDAKIEDLLNVAFCNKSQEIPQPIEAKSYYENYSYLRI